MSINLIKFNLILRPVSHYAITLWRVFYFATGLRRVSHSSLLINHAARSKKKKETTFGQDDSERVQPRLDS